MCQYHSDSLSLLKNLFGLRIGWQTKITTDDIDDISSVEAAKDVQDLEY